MLHSFDRSMNPPVRILRYVLAAILGLLWFAPASMADPIPRIAIVASPGDARLAAFSDLLTAELSKEGNRFALVERGELRRLEQEAQVQQLQVAERPLALARLAKADGLVFLGTDMTNPKMPSFTLRLTVCHNGLILRSLRLGADEKEMPTAARLAATSLSFVSNRLLNANETPLGVSLLGLRSLSSTGDPTAIALNQSLGHQLSSGAGVVVLERWKMDDIAFERSISAQESPLLTGSTLVDGSFERTQVGFKVTVRLRNSENATGDIQVIECESTEIPEVAEKVAGAIEARLGLRATPYQAEAEAKFYAELGAWLVARGLPSEAAQACESAIALGDRRAETSICRLRAYSKIVNPEEDIEWYWPARNDDCGLSQRAEQEFHVALESAIRIAHYLCDLARAGWPGFEISKKESEMRFHLVRGGLEVGEQVLQGICMRQGARLRFANEAKLLRKLCRELVAAGAALSGNRFNEDDVHVGYIHDTPEQAIAAYRRMLKADRLSQSGGSLRSDFWIVSHSKVHPAKAIDWDAQPESHAQTVWAAFIDELANSENLLHQVDSLAFRYHESRDSAERDQILGQYCALLERNRDWFLSAPGQLATCAAFGSRWISRDTRRPSENATRFTRLVLDLFQNAPWLEKDVYFLATLLFHTTSDPTQTAHPFLSLAMAREFLIAIDAYLQRAQADVRWQKAGQASVVETFDKLRMQIFQAYPALAAERLKTRPAVEGAVPIHAWMPPSTGSREGDWVDGSRLSWDGHRLVVPLAGNRILTFDPTTGESHSFAAPGNGRQYWTMAVANGRILAFTDRLQFADYGRGPTEWREIPAPELKGKSARISACGDAFYIGASTAVRDGRTFQSLVGKWRGDQIEWIVSSNRAIAQNPLDAKRPRGFMHAFPGHAGNVYATLNLPLGFHQLFNLSKGEFLADFDMVGRVQASGDMVLHWRGHEDDGVLTYVFGMDPRHEKPVLLLRNSESNNPYGSPRNGWEKVKPLADFSHPDFRGEIIAPIVHEGILWLLKWDAVSPGTHTLHNPDDLRLVGVHLATAKTVVVPLRYDVSEELRKVKDHNGLDMARPLIDGRSLTSTPSSLYFTVRNGEDRYPDDHGPYSPAILHVRWSEVEAWIAAHAPDFPDK